MPCVSGSRNGSSFLNKKNLLFGKSGYNKNMKEYLKVSLLPKDTNASGTIFGGVIMSYMDIAGLHCARDGYDNNFVTRHIYDLDFLSPVFVGDIVTFRGEILEHTHSSVTVFIEVEAERYDTREKFLVTQAKIVYVAVDASRQKIALNKR